MNPERSTRIASGGLTNAKGSSNIRSMHEETKAILRGLVPVAWADGKFEDSEKQVIQALLDAFGATEDEAEEFKA